jgi:hypothetical protein
MAARGVKAAPRKAEPVVDEEAEPDYTVYRDKGPTGTMEAFADWIIEVCEIEFPNGKAEEQFRDGVRLGGTLRMEFQRSDFWKTDKRNPRSDAGRKARATANGSQSETPAKPATRRGRAKPAAEIEEDETAEETAKPASRPRRTAAKPATASRRSGRRGAAAKPVEGEGTEAPY